MVMMILKRIALLQCVMKQQVLAVIAYKNNFYVK